MTTRSPVAAGTQPRVIVLGTEHPRGVAAIRSLARNGIPVIGVDHRPYPRGLYSRYLSGRHRVGSSKAEQLALLAVLGREGGGMLMPTTDHYLGLVAENRDRLAQHFILTTPPQDVLYPLMHKVQCYEIARRAGVETPACFLPTSVEDLKSAIASLDLDRDDYILKVMPDTGPADVVSGRNTMAAGSSRETIEANCLEIHSRLNVFPMIERVVHGGAPHCIGVTLVVDRNHEAVLGYCIRRLQLSTYSMSGRFVHPYEMGANVFCESIIDEEALEASRRIVREGRYFGPITLEFRRDAVDGTLIFIKADPRFVRATSLSTVLGLDVPLALYRVFTDQPVSIPASYPEGYGWVWLLPLLQTLVRQRRNRPVRQALWDLRNHVTRIRAFGYLSVSDPLPALVQLQDWTLTALRARVATLRSAPKPAG